MKILWLTSWYPNPYQPYTGDFIQRHAQAVAEYIPVDVIHVLQTGGNSKEETIINTNGRFTEYFYGFGFSLTGITWLDKIRYNIAYRKYYKKLLQTYFSENGMPALVHVHVPLKAGLAALYVLKKYKIPYIVSEQSSHYEATSPDYFFKRSTYYRYACRRIFGNAAAVTNVSATIGKILLKIFTIKHYTTIHNLVDTSLFYYKPMPPAPKARLLHASALGEQKNPEGIIKALELLKKINSSWECTVCGPYTNELVQLAGSYGLSNDIHFTGEVPYSQVAVHMQASDIFILFSNHENFPCVVIEALCCGLPVVSSVAGGIAEAVNETNGILVAPRDEEALANALHNIIININNYNREEIAEKATALYNKSYIGGRFINLYKQVIEKQQTQ